MKKSVKCQLKRIVFNIIETILILLIGKLLNLPINFILIVMFTFLLSRSCFGKTMHFKTWYRCLIYSLTIMLSLFLILKVDLILSIIFTIFAAFIMTGKADINELYLWKNSDEPSKYQDIIDFVKYNEFDDKLLEFEDKIKKRNNLEYLIYKYRFKDGKTFSEMSELLDMDNPRIVEQLDKIAFAIRLYCGI